MSYELLKVVLIYSERDVNSLYSYRRLALPGVTLLLLDLGILTKHLHIGQVNLLFLSYLHSIITGDDGGDEKEDYTADLQVGEGDVPRPEEERETLAAKNQRLQKQLEELKGELKKTQDDTKRTAEDIIHIENVMQGEL